MHIDRRLRSSLLTFAALTAALAANLNAQGIPIGFEESFALAPDRQRIVASLIPGTDDFYYYQCRERLDARDFATVQKVLPIWTQRHGRNQRVIEIENRAALLGFADNPAGTFAFLRDRLRLGYDHQQIVPGAKSTLPDRLDASLLSPSRLTQQALAQYPGTVRGFTQRALAGLASTALDADTLRNLLSRLDRPDVDNLPALIVRDLEAKHSQGFGTMPVHDMLRLPQLEECLRLQPALLREPRFVNAYLARLRPDDDLDWRQDATAYAAQLARVYAFAQRLPPSFNSLRAHVLYRWLEHDLTLGAPDKDRFLAYIRLPRRSGYPAEAHLRRNQDAEYFVDQNRAYPTDLPIIGDDTQLVQACLEHFFASEDSYASYAEFLDANWLKGVLAETKILLGQGDMERWYSMMNDPARLDALKKRIELTFPPTQRRFYDADEAVTLTLDTKNVGTLLVKVFTIDAYRYHIEKQKVVDASIELDGIVANAEQTYNYDEPPLRRVRRTFPLPMLREPGTYVVEFVGNGISSRAVIHKGGLRMVERTAAAGQSVRVYDLQGRHRKNAIAWFGGREYTADTNGEILVPFSTDPEQKKLVLRDGNVSSLVPFDHRAESYSLTGSVLVDRESLIAGAKARLLVRPQLRLDDHDVALSLLQKPVLVIVATDLDGLSTTQEVRDPALVDEREFVHEIQVPERLAQLQVSLRGTVKNLANTDTELATDVSTFAINGIDTLAETGTPMLVRTSAGYAIELRGKNGELQPGRVCGLQLHHRDYTDAIQIALQTDASGRIALGTLPGIDSIDAQYRSMQATFAPLRTAACRMPDELQASAGTTLRIPYQGERSSVTRAEFSLLGVDRDAFEHLALANGFVELRDLAPGDYELRLFRTDTRIPVRITRGKPDDRWLVGRDRMLESTAAQPLQVQSLDLSDGTLRVQLANPTADTRVHVVATRYLPTFDAFQALLGAPSHMPAAFASERLDSTYHAGRQLGDEYRYVLERRFTTKYPGNMLSRPSLLLNPWALEDTRNAPVGLEGGAGGAFGGRGGGRRAGGAKNKGGQVGTWGTNPGTIANLDYFPAGSSLLANLTPDTDGVVRVPETSLGDGQIVHVVVLDGDQAIYQTLVRAEKPLTPRARTLPQSLDAASHLTEQRRIEFVAAGSTTVLADARSAKVEIHDSLGSVYHLFGTLSRDAEWSRFAFLLQWPALTAEQKQELYSEHACHELHFFLYHKDRAFFDAVVKPFLTNKLDKTFVDHWLCGDDLRHYVEPWAFEQLNLIEKILLAQRLEGAAKLAVARVVKEQLELRPVDRQRIGRLFDLALKSDELADKDSSVLRALAAAPSAGLPAEKPMAPPADSREAKEELGKAAAEAPAPDAATGADDFYLGKKRRDELEARKQVRALFRAVNPTKLLVEQNYWHRRMAQTTADVVAPNQFWVDYATAPLGQPFVSAAIVEASNSFLEMMMALAVLDLPFEAGKHEVTADGELRTLRAATPLLLVRKEVTKTEKAADTAPMLLGENFFRLDDRYRFDNGERRDAFVQGEFLVDVAYGCQVVVTNPTSMPRTAEVLLQIPAGAIPVQRGFWTKGVTVELPPYGTQTVEYAFYFPKAGTFAHYPAHAAEKAQLAAFAEPRSLKVVDTLSTIDTTSWEHVSQQGTDAEVMTFLDTHNVQRLDLGKIAWRMKDREFFAALLQKLRTRHVYHDTLWSYALLHRDLPAAHEYLQHQDNFLQQCGAYLDSPLVRIDPKERRQFEQIELDPLVHARAHRFGGQRMLGNQDLARQYSALMTILGYHPTLDADDWLVVTYYFLLQDRVEEALQSFAKVDASQVHTKVQYDYLSAYLCFFTGDVTKARQLAERHKDDPVQHWQKRFRDVLQQLDEVEGKASPTTGDPTADSLAATAPALELAIEGKQISLNYKNLAQCEVRYYELDVEFAFSAQPFASDGGTSAAFVQPNAKQTRDLPDGQSQTTFELPAALQQKNVLVEVRAAGLVRSKQYFANAFDVRFLESYGQIAVTEPGNQKPLPKTYVKVFARLANGTVRFHKDGYTDLRGRFDYASVSDDPNAGATKYAVLVLHEQRGASIREVTPPTK